MGEDLNARAASDLERPHTRASSTEREREHHEHERREQGLLGKQELGGDEAARARVGEGHGPPRKNRRQQDDQVRLAFRAPEQRRVHRVAREHRRLHRDFRHALRREERLGSKHRQERQDREGTELGGLRKRHAFWRSTRHDLRGCPRRGLYGPHHRSWNAPGTQQHGAVRPAPLTVQSHCDLRSVQARRFSKNEEEKEKQKTPFCPPIFLKKKKKKKKKKS